MDSINLDKEEQRLLRRVLSNALGEYGYGCPRCSRNPTSLLDFCDEHQPLLRASVEALLEKFKRYK